MFCIKLIRTDIAARNELRTKAAIANLPQNEKADILCQIGDQSVLQPARASGANQLFLVSLALGVKEHSLTRFRRRSVVDTHLRSAPSDKAFIPSTGDKILSRANWFRPAGRSGPRLPHGRGQWTGVQMQIKTSRLAQPRHHRQATRDRGEVLLL